MDATLPVDTPPLCLDVADATPAALATRPKRKQSLKAGRSKCWFPMCMCVAGLDRYEPSRAADVRLRLRIDHNLDADEPYPAYDNKLCPEHLPSITPHQVLGAHVAVVHKGVFIQGTVSDLGRGGLFVSNPAIPLTVAKPWRVDWEGVPPLDSPMFFSTEEVAEASKLYAALDDKVKSVVKGALGEKQPSAECMP